MGNGGGSINWKNIGVLQGKLGSAIFAGQSKGGFFGFVWSKEV